MAIANKARSPWREMKLINIVITSGVIELSTLIENFDVVSEHLKVESRKSGKYRMQLALYD
jgi:hypothetical protein